MPGLLHNCILSTFAKGNDKKWSLTQQQICSYIRLQIAGWEFTAKNSQLNVCQKPNMCYLPLMEGSNKIFVFCALLHFIRLYFC